MPRGPRRGNTTARRVQRKVEKTLLATHGGYEGKSIIEVLETELLEACISYLECPKEYRHDLAKGARGVIRGLATAVAVWRNMYAQDIKGVEKEFIRLARAQITNV